MYAFGYRKTWKEILPGYSAAYYDVGDLVDIATALGRAIDSSAAGDKLVVGGYSRGAVFALELATRLEKRGVTVDALILIDPVNTALQNHATVVPKNCKTVWYGPKQNRFEDLAAEKTDGIFDSMEIDFNAARLSGVKVQQFAYPMTGAGAARRHKNHAETGYDSSAYIDIRATLSNQGLSLRPRSLR